VIEKDVTGKEGWEIPHGWGSGIEGLREALHMLRAWKIGFDRVIFRVVFVVGVGFLCVCFCVCCFFVGVVGGVLVVWDGGYTCGGFWVCFGLVAWLGVLV